MKKLLFIFTMLPLASFAQNFELGLNGGIATNSKPTGDMYYKGNSAAINYSSNMSLLANLNHNMQIGIEGHVMQLSRNSSKYYSKSIDHPATGDDGKLFIYSKVSTALCAVLNKKIDAGHGYFYGGVALGFGIARNFGSKDNSVAASYVAADGGRGACFGLQVGYTYYFANRWGLNIEGAVRDFDLDYDAPAPVYHVKTNMYTRIVAYTGTVGFRFAFGGFKNGKVNRGYTPDQP